eukprot:TRINITY_DN8079_c0_g1_i1.p1 TRINITY_DN8079_c0_g1~~TRINITY_DN8079_c0_g1_i1.p1  ORF type:complete len:171 (+),score=55.15 TRINITY_DN8079_c0_g1_i1:166-678(+)
MVTYVCRIGNGNIDWKCAVSIQQNVFNKMEKMCLMDLEATMQQKIQRDRKPLFQVWMNEDQDKVQICGEAYSLRMVNDACLDAINKECRDTKALVKQCLLLSMYYDASKHLGYLMLQGIVDANDAKILNTELNTLSAELARKSLSICESFGIPSKLLPPIAMDWIEYNNG